MEEHFCRFHFGLAGRCMYRFLFPYPVDQKLYGVVNIFHVHRKCFVVFNFCFYSHSWFGRNTSVISVENYVTDPGPKVLSVTYVLLFPLEHWLLKFYLATCPCFTSLTRSSEVGQGFSAICVIVIY